MPDFAIAVSNHYRWDAASTVVDPATGRRASVQAAYADSATDFRTMVASAQQTLRLASTTYPGVPYPYPKTTIVLGSADEEYPMMVNDGSNLGNPTAASLPENAFTGFVATHEILHSWFPFYMGINEKRYPFMDEGWTTAFEYLRNRDVLGVPTADALFKSFRANPLTTPGSGFDLPIITPHDSLWGQTPIFAHNQYGKAALGYLALKDLMGDDAFRTGLHTFMTRWHGKRPLPWDMFNSFSHTGVGDVTWFFRNWFFGYGHMDVSVGRSPAIVAAALAGCILAYDGGLKHTRVGPLVMGACRGLDVTMALSTGLALDGRWPPLAIAGPAVLALYITGLTYIARDEVDGNTTRRARTGLVVIAAVALAALAGLAVAAGLPRSPLAWPWVALALGLAWRNWAPVWHRHDGPSTGRAIGGGIMLVPVIDATLAAVAGCPILALGVLALIAPALVLKQFFSPT